MNMNFKLRFPIQITRTTGFVGDVNSVWGQVPPYAYGVYAGPVADLLQHYGSPGQSCERLFAARGEAKISRGETDHPPGSSATWRGGVPVSYTDSEGRTTVVAAFEHVVILTGYDQDSNSLYDQWQIYDTPTSVFLNSWGVLGNMAVIYDN